MKLPVVVDVSNWIWLMAMMLCMFLGTHEFKRECIEVTTLD